MNARANVSQREILKTWLCNPFYYVAGGTALAIGLGVIIIAAINGSASNTHFDGVFDVHTGLQAPLVIHFFEGLVDWLALSTFVYLAGLLITSTRFRAIDVFGTQAFARFPTLLTAFAALLPGYQRQAMRLAAMNHEIVAADIAAFVVAGVVIIAAVIWMILLMYRAFSVSCNVKGTKAIVAFIVASLVAEALSKVIILWYGLGFWLGD